MTDLCKRCPLHESIRRHPGGRPRLLSARQESELVKWWDQQSTVQAKAQELGISVNCLYSALARYGRLKPRPAYKERLARERELESL